MTWVGRATMGGVIVDSTRLLVLGVTRQEQPATGYAIMRELAAWEVQDWASVNPGSIYGALRTLVKDGLVVEDTEAARAVGNARVRKNSTKYRLTDNGEASFATLVHNALEVVAPYEGASFMTALCFLVDLPRTEVVAALEQRTARLEEWAHRLETDEEQKYATSSTKPPHSVEFVKLAADRLRGELHFTQALLQRITEGRYLFVGE